MSELCRWLHEQIEVLPLISFPFDVNLLPLNGIYFFYERGETWGHGGSKPRIVRVGTARDGNFRSRVAEHYLLKESKMNFGPNQPAPHERSIFRKHLGMALLNKAHDPYLSIWKVDLTPRSARDELASRRDIVKEKSIEAEATRRLRANFSFRYITIEGEESRMGSKGLERVLIGTLARCSSCEPSETWLGKFSPKREIRESGLWLVQHLKAPEMTSEDQSRFSQAVLETLRLIATTRR